MNDDEFDQMLRERHDSFVTDLASRAPYPPSPRRDRATSPRPTKARIKVTAPVIRAVLQCAVFIAIALIVYSALSAPPEDWHRETYNHPDSSKVAPSRTEVTQKGTLIIFQPNSAALDSDADYRIRFFAQSLVNNAGYTITLVGRTGQFDQPGLDEQLSSDRANAVRNVLLAHGISSMSIRIEVVGRDRPLSPDRDQQGNVTPDAGRRDSSVEIVVIHRQL